MFLDTPHRRLNILTNQWVLVSPHRMKRPWQGKVETLPKKQKISYDEKCYLCPGNTRANGTITEKYTETFVFDNDFGALMNNPKSETINDGLLTAKQESGICKVICFSPDHSLTLADMEVVDIEKVVQTWKNEYQTLGAKENIGYVQIFENKGAMMGCSNPHPHGQIWAQENLPNEVILKNDSFEKYWKEKKSNLLSDYLKQELEKDERIIYQNEDFVVLVPFWAVWPFETMIIPKKSAPSISNLSQTESLAFADAISKITQKYDRLFDASFPYSAGIHQSPTNGDYPHWQFHMSFYPPLLRSATVKKFMVGYEMFGMPQRDLTAEAAAQKLKNA